MKEPTGVTREGGRLAVPATLFADGPEPPFVLFDRRGRLADLAIARTVYVAPSDARALDEFLRTQLTQVMTARRVAEPARAWALHRSLLSAVEQALRELPEPQALQRLLPVVEIAATHVATEPGIYLAEVAHSMPSPATHAVATALYGLTVAVGEGIDDRESLMRIGLAGVLADVWKFRMPRLVARGSDLTDAERLTLRAHPEHGAELLQRAGVRSRGAIEAVRRTTSDGTVPATPRGCGAPRSRWRRASCALRTHTRPSPWTARTPPASAATRRCWRWHSPRASSSLGCSGPSCGRSAERSA